MRWKLPTVLPASAAILLLPSLLLTAPQQLSHAQQHDAVVSSSIYAAPRPTGQSIVDESPHTYFRDTHTHMPPDVKKINPDDVSALATLALAGSDSRAVRAPCPAEQSNCPPGVAAPSAVPAGLGG